MRRRILYRFPFLARIAPIIRAAILIDTALSFYERLPITVKLGVNTGVLALLAWLAQIWLVFYSYVEANWRGFVTILAAGIIL